MEDNRMKNVDQYDRACSLASQVIHIARDHILMNLRFLSVAMSALTPKPEQGRVQAASDGKLLYYEPVTILKHYKDEPGYAIRLYLHSLFHQIFYHGFHYDQVEQPLWDIAADIAVENTVLELQLPGSSLRRDEKALRKLKVLKEDVSAITAEKLYRFFKLNPLSEREIREYQECFQMDSHEKWLTLSKEELTISLEQWKKLSERVQADLRSFSNHKNGSEALTKNLSEALKERYSYKELLQKFMVMNENIQVNDDEFDYIYYTYGLETYGNMPLIEPLEYKDSKKIKEFVIAIDTSASCRGEVVENFIKKTYAILSGEDNFFRKMNVHLIQCDNEVQKDTKITSKEDLEAFLKNEKLTGFGSTDFRPVFTYVEKLKEEREFENLKGLIYFTDGYGVYPQKMPDYDVMFAFVDNGFDTPEVPSWAIKVVLEDEY